MKKIIDVNKIIDDYKRKEDERFERISEFEKGKIPYLLSFQESKSYINHCNNIEDSFLANLSDFNNTLNLPSETLPFLEPWFGVGVIAEAFGSKYYWWEKEAPTCHAIFDKLIELDNISVISTKMINMVLDAIVYFKNKTNNMLPICMTDIQSAIDTAILILDPCEVLTSTYTKTKSLHKVLKKLNNLTIKFAKLQSEILERTLALPGHGFYFSTIKGNGIALSDDCLAISSPNINNNFLLPYDYEFGKEFGSVAIHSCGDWSHSMGLLPKSRYVSAIDCVLEGGNDVSFNIPEVIRDSFKKTNIIVQVRINPEVDESIKALNRLLHEDLKLVVCSIVDTKNHSYQFKKLKRILENFYNK